jgi:hypothetical protein
MFVILLNLLIYTLLILTLINVGICVSPVQLYSKALAVYRSLQKFAEVYRRLQEITEDRRQQV